MTTEVTKIIEEAAKRAEEETAAAPAPKFAGELSWPVQVNIGKGLEGAITCESKIGYVHGDKGWLVYRGYNIFDLAANSSFEETSYLLLFGKLPSKKELSDFDAKLKGYRKVPSQVIDTLKAIPKETHPMAALRSGISVLGCLDPTADDMSVENETEISIRLIAQMATVAAAFARIREGKEPVEPDNSLTHTGNFLYMMRGSKADELMERIMDVSLILHADHGMNASTFTTMVVNSSLSDMYSSIVAGIGSLKGPLHGGANEQVLYVLDEIGNPSNVDSWYVKAKETKRKVMGFGHRVYKAYDPRARILGPLAELMSEKYPELKSLCETAKILDDTVCEDLGKTKKVFPNVDFYSGIVYRGFGIETGMFTPIFAVSRISGWTARVLEYLADNRIFRPRAVYVGPMEAKYVPIGQR